MIIVFDADVTGTVDLRGVNGRSIQGIEVLDMDNGAANILVLDDVNLRNLLDEGGQASGVVNRVLVNGNAGDAVHLASTGGGSWSAAGTQVFESTTYDVYAHSANAWDRLWVEQGTGVVLL